MKRYLNTFFLSLCVIVAFVLFYMTSATLAMPGASAKFLASTLFPSVLDHQPCYLLDAVLFHGVESFFSGGSLLTGVRILTASIGALIVLLVLRSLQTMIYLAVCDGIDNTPEEKAQARADRVFVKRFTTCFFAPLVMVAFPLWVMATRPMDGQFTVLLLTLLFWLSLILRSQYETALEYNEQLPSYVNPLLALTFGLLTFLFMLSPSLLVVLILPFCLSSRVFILVHFENRMTQMMWALMGILIGAFMALAFFALGWYPLFCSNATLSWGLLWATQFQSGLKALPTVIQSFESIAGWVFFLLNAALFLGSFPRAFYKAFSPLLGQFCILASWGFVFAGWPSSFWMSMIEPDPIASFGMILLVLNTALVVASWLRNWLDMNLRRSTREKYQWATLIVAFPSLLLLGGSLYFFTPNATCTLANDALRKVWSTVDFSLPTKPQMWLNPSDDCEEFIVQRYVDEKPLFPLASPTQNLNKISIAGKLWETLVQEDPLLQELAAIGDAPLITYLQYSSWRTDVFVGDPYRFHRENVVDIAKTLATTPFAQTTLGERTVKEFYSLAALQLANEAAGKAAPEALEMFRQATQYDPENKGVILSVASFANEGYAVSEEEIARATTVYNEFPYLENPSLKERAQFEKRYGYVRSPSFDAAHRSAHFNSGIETEACLENLVRLYKVAPHTLSLDERLYALLHMPEADALEVMQRTILSGQEELLFFRELECFLLLHIHTPGAQALYERHRHRFEITALRGSYVKKLYEVTPGSPSFEILSEKIVTFYHRDKVIAYAFYYVNYLLSKDRLQEATDFLTAFDVHENLSRQPLFNQYLLRRLVEAWTPQDPVKAQQLLAAWLFSNPQQPVLWTLYLQRLTDPEQLQKAVHECLSYYPLHPLATQLFAKDCAQRLGDDIAQRYLDSVQNAQHIDARNAPHAHR